MLYHEPDLGDFVGATLEPLLANVRQLLTLGSPFARLAAVTFLADLARVSQRARPVILLVRSFATLSKSVTILLICIGSHAPELLQTDEGLNKLCLLAYYSINGRASSVLLASQIYYRRHAFESGLFLVFTYLFCTDHEVDLLQEEVFGPVSFAFKEATTSAVRFAKGKLGAEKGDVVDAVFMARALTIILGDGTKTSKMLDVQTTVKNLVYLQKHSSPEDAEIFAAVLYQMQQGAALT